MVKILFSLLLIPVMFSQAQEIPSKLIPKVKALEGQFGQITKERKAELETLAVAIKKSLATTQEASLTFVCTHNSRRSQLAQVWFAMAAEWYGIDSLHSYSGGTEATAFNHRMVAALNRFGFDILKKTEDNNPVYHFSPNPNEPQMLTLFSKKYDDTFNPQKDFIAVMVCSDADESCPVVNGASFRQSLPYIDPKVSDNTDQEEDTYDAKVAEIGREMLYLVKEIKK